MNNMSAIDRAALRVAAERRKARELTENQPFSVERCPVSCDPVPAVFSSGMTERLLLWGLTVLLAQNGARPELLLALLYIAM